MALGAAHGVERLPAAARGRAAARDLNGQSTYFFWNALKRNAPLQKCAELPSWVVGIYAFLTPLDIWIVSAH